MTTDNFSFGFAILTRLVALMLASCALVACAGHAPTRPAAVVPSVRGHGSGNTERSEAEVKRDLAKNERNTLSVSEAGYYLDVLQARLVQALGADVKLSRTPDRIGIDLAHRVPFESRGPWISEASCRLLQPLASALVEYRKTAVVVKVGANGTGKDAERLAYACRKRLRGPHQALIAASEFDRTQPLPQRPCSPSPNSSGEVRPVKSSMSFAS